MTHIDTMLTDYAAGRLSPAKHSLASAYLRRKPDAANDAALEDAVAGELLSNFEGSPMSDGFFGAMSAALGTIPSAPSDNQPREGIEAHLDGVNWRKRLPGISTHDILGGRKGEGDRLFLLKVKQGFTIWDHSHTGDEWVLVLKGSYMSGGQLYAAGDLHMESVDTEHALKASDDQDCICLVMTQGPVKMASRFGRMLAPIAGL